MNEMSVWIAVAVIALTTAAIRFLPFIIWSGNRKTPKIIDKLGRVLPAAVMGMLVVYCLKDVSFSSVDGFLPPLIASVVVSVLYIWKRNTLVSIVAGTVCYMILVQLVF